MYFICMSIEVYFFFCIQISHWPSTTYWKDILSPLITLVIFWSKIICPFMYEFLFCSSTYVVCYFTLIPYCLNSVSTSLKIKYCYSSNFILPFKVSLTILGPLHCHMNIRISLLILQNACWDFHWNIIESINHFQKKCYLKILNIWSFEQSISLFIYVFEIFVSNYL